MSASSNTKQSYPPSFSSRGTPITAASLERIPPLLSFIAGMVDVIGYLKLRVFTAHVTGNLVIIAAALVRGEPLLIDQFLAVPVFLFAVVVVWRTAKALNKRGAALARPLLLMQFLLLLCVLIVALVFDPSVKPREAMADVNASLAVSAMACQFALLRLTMPGAPSAAVMSGNLAHAVLALLDTISKSRPLLEGARQGFKKAFLQVASFFAGCMVGAAAVLWFGKWAWAFPVAAAAVVVALAPASVSLSEQS